MSVTPSIPLGFRSWRTITVGTYQNLIQIREALTERNIFINSWARNVLSKTSFGVAQQEVRIDLVRGRIKDLNPPPGVTYKMLRVLALKRRWKSCSIELAAQMRLQYTDQPKDERLWPLMEPVQLNEDTGIFSLEHSDGRLVLRGGIKPDDIILLPDDELVMIHPRY